MSNCVYSVILLSNLPCCVAGGKAQDRTCTLETEQSMSRACQAADFCTALSICGVLYSQVWPCRKQPAELPNRRKRQDLRLLKLRRNIRKLLSLCGMGVIFVAQHMTGSQGNAFCKIRCWRILEVSGQVIFDQLMLNLCNSTNLYLYSLLIDVPNQHFPGDVHLDDEAAQFDGDPPSLLQTKKHTTKPIKSRQCYRHFRLKTTPPCRKRPQTFWWPVQAYPKAWGHHSGQAGINSLSTIITNQIVNMSNQYWPLLTINR